MTTRGTQNSEPSQIEIKRKRVTNEGLKIDLLVRWDISEVTIEDEVSGETHNEWEYEQETYTVSVDDNKQGGEDYVKNNGRMMRLKAQAKREARTNQSVMSDSERQDLRNNRAKMGKGN